MARPSHPLSRTAGSALRLGLALAIAGLVALAFAQRFVQADHWWLELSRFMPYPVLLAICGGVLAAAAGLGLRWLLAGAAALAAVAVLAMGLVWGRPAQGGQPVRVMSYNIKAYRAAEHPDGFAALLREVQARRPDILLVQDNIAVSRERAHEIWPGGRAFGFEHAFAAGQYIIASRYPLDRCTPLGGARGPVAYSALRCRVDAGGVPLTVVTTHFESPRIGLNAARREGLEGLDDWRRNHVERLAQARALAIELAGEARPLVVAGDLNAPEDSPVVSALLATGLRDAFSSAARGYGYTYGHRMRFGVSFLRIDHVLVSPGLGVAGSFAGGAEASEHRPVIADLLLPPR